MDSDVANVWAARSRDNRHGRTGSFHKHAQCRALRALLRLSFGSAALVYAKGVERGLIKLSIGRQALGLLETFDRLPSARTPHTIYSGVLVIALLLEVLLNILYLILGQLLALVVPAGWATR